MTDIRPLRYSDDRSGFCSGNPDLDRFLSRFAGQNQFRHHIGTTYIAAGGNTIMGFATVSASHIEIRDLPDIHKKGLPKYPLPVLRLSRLAVDMTWADENVTNRVANCDPVFVSPIFFNLKISRLQNSRNKNGISFLRASTTDSSPQMETAFNELIKKI